MLNIKTAVVRDKSAAFQLIPQLVDLWHQGRFPFDKLVRSFPLAQINEAVHALESGQVLKAILQP